MSYIFHLKIEKEKSYLSLRKDTLILDIKEWEEGRDMGRKLFENISKLLTENNMNASEISAFTIDSDIPENYTSMRIAETVKKVYTFGVTS